MRRAAERGQEALDRILDRPIELTAKEMAVIRAKYRRAHLQHLGELAVRAGHDAAESSFNDLLGTVDPEADESGVEMQEHGQ
jgi:hypothetical protein